MKKLLIFALFLLPLWGLGGFLFAQSTELRPGLVLPQMTTAQRTGAVNATNGMLVFDTNTQSYWFRQSGAWVELLKGSSTPNYWQLNGIAGNEVKNTNSGGFWSANPTIIDGVSTSPTAPVSGAGTRLMWIPSRSAFRVGTIQTNEWDATNIGPFSFASGLNTSAKGSISTAIGNYTTANGQISIAMGVATTASGDVSTAMGNSSTASGYTSTAMGATTTASGDYSTAMGRMTTAGGKSSIAMGDSTTANGEACTAIGQFTTASGKASTAMGWYTTASGWSSVAMGRYTLASGKYSTAMGYYTMASGFASTAMGYLNVDDPNALLMVGNGGQFGRPFNALVVRNNNRVGIGINEPLAPLHVAGQSTITGGGQGHLFNFGSTTLFGYTGLEYPSIVADASILSKTTIGAFQAISASDNRIKNIIGLSDNAEDLARLRKIEITNYRMKDQATWGNKIFKKVIAQQVESIYPEVINCQKAVIPDIYTLAESVEYDNAKKELKVLMSKGYNIKVGDKIRLIDRDNGENQAEVVAVEGKSFTVKNWLTEAKQVFVFGREVNDFRSVDYEALSMLGISAIQQLAKEVEELQTTNSELRTTNVELRSTNAELRMNNEKMEARLDRIEATIQSTVQSGK